MIQKSIWRGEVVLVGSCKRYCGRKTGIRKRLIDSLQKDSSVTYYRLSNSIQNGCP